jgi:hypothetical protein
MSIDERFIKALHVEVLREQDLQPEDKPHVIAPRDEFQRCGRS